MAYFRLFNIKHLKKCTQSSDSFHNKCSNNLRPTVQGMQDVVNELREILVGSGTCLDVLNRKEFICSQQKLSQILQVEEQVNCS